MQQDTIIPVISSDTSPENSSPNIGKTPHRWRSAFSTLGILVAAPLAALILTAFIFQSYEVEGQSMETTLQNRDRLIVWKAPRTFAKITGKTYAPTRNDVVVFKKAGLTEGGSGQDKQLIKRVIGLPGDRVVIREGFITIYNGAHPEGYNPDVDQVFSKDIASLTTGNIDVVVSDGEVFVCGDNRTNSQDSRSFGPISTNDIVGTMTLRIFPISKFKSFI